MNKLIFAVAGLFLLAGIGNAEPAGEIDAATEDKIRNSLNVLLPGLKPDSVRATPVRTRSAPPSVPCGAHGVWCCFSPWR